MKSSVRLSIYAITVTLAVVALFVWGIFSSLNHTQTLVSVTVIFVVVIVAALLYAPLFVEADEETLTVRSALRKHRIPLERIRRVEAFKPAPGMNSIASYRFRVFASGGFMGYWGIFYDGDIGKYAAYFGKPSECFLLTLDNGEKYAIGCSRRDEMMEYISSRISQK